MSNTASDRANVRFRSDSEIASTAGVMFNTSTTHAHGSSSASLRGPSQDKFAEFQRILSRG